MWVWTVEAAVVRDLLGAWGGQCGCDGRGGRWNGGGVRKEVGEAEWVDKMGEMEVCQAV